MSPFIGKQVRRYLSNVGSFPTQATSKSEQGSLRTLSISFLLAFWFAAGCSTIPEDVTLLIESTPSGVDVISSEGWQCSTPCTRSVRRDSQIDLKLEQAGYQSIEQAVEIPDLKPSRIGTYIGTGVGVVSGIVAINLGEAIGMVVFDVFFAGLLGPFELSTREKLEVVAQGALVFGGIGYAIDRIRDGERAKRPHRVDISMVEHDGDGKKHRSELVESHDANAD